MHKDVKGSGPEPMKAKCWGDDFDEGRNAESVEHSMRERSR